MRFSSLRPPAPNAYDEAKAAEIAAFFAIRKGGAVGVLTLAKLMYLAERESFERYSGPLTGDRLCSMEHGPVLSESLNYIRGEARPPQEWQRLFNQRDGNALSLQDNDLTEDDLLRLSDADLELLDGIWQRFGHMTAPQLWRYTHQLPEYDDPGKSSLPIDMERLLGAVGYSEDEMKEILGRMDEQNQYRAALKKAAV